MNGMKDQQDILKRGKIHKIRSEIRLCKLEIDRQRNKLALATSEFHEYEDLHLYLDDVNAAVIEYGTQVNNLRALVDRLKELEG